MWSKSDHNMHFILYLENMPIRGVSYNRRAEKEPPSINECGSFGGVQVTTISGVHLKPKDKTGISPHL